MKQQQRRKDLASDEYEGKQQGMRWWGRRGLWEIGSVGRGVSEVRKLKAQLT